MSSSAVIPKTPFVLFLDIDHVIFIPMEHDVLGKAEQLFPEKSKFSSTELDIAATHFFSEIAMKALNYLIEELGKTREVQIVISSRWREKRTPQELRDIFAIHDFAKKIIDKTPEIISKDEHTVYCGDDRHKTKEFPGSIQCRAAEINYWLKAHTEVIDYAILDDQDNHLSLNFPNKFFKIPRILTKEICDRVLTANAILIPKKEQKEENPSVAAVDKDFERQREEKVKACKKRDEEAFARYYSSIGIGPGGLD